MNTEYQDMLEKSKKLAKLRISLQECLVKRDQWQTCLNCDSFNAKTEECFIFKARPPAYIITSGCENHMMIIPF